MPLLKLVERALSVPEILLFLSRLAVCTVLNRGMVHQTPFALHVQCGIFPYDVRDMFRVPRRDEQIRMGLQFTDINPVPISQVPAQAQGTGMRQMSAIDGPAILLYFTEQEDEDEDVVGEQTCLVAKAIPFNEALDELIAAGPTTVVHSAFLGECHVAITEEGLLRLETCVLRLLHEILLTCWDLTALQTST